VEIQRALEAGAPRYMLKSMPAEGAGESDSPGPRGEEAHSPQLAAQLAEHLSDET